MKYLEILERIKSGQTDGQIARALEVEAQQVAKIRAEAGERGLVKPPPMTHEQRAKRRQEIVDFIQAGGDRHKAAEKFGVSIATVENVVRAATGLRKRAWQRDPERTVDVSLALVAMFVQGASDSAAAEHAGCSREWASKIRERWQKAEQAASKKRKAS
jgi:transposase